jgi:hypothetical protein
MAISVDLSMDGRTLLFIAASSLLTGVLFGIVPAFRATRHTDIAGALHGTRLKIGSRRWSAALIVAQVALCVVVLVSAGLLLGSLRKLQQVDPGFRKGHVLLLTIRPDNYKGQSAVSLHREILRRLSAIPGVEVVTTFMDAPLGGSSITTKGFSINYVGPGFFETMGIPLLAGRAPRLHEKARGRSRQQCEEHRRGRDAKGMSCDELGGPIGEGGPPGVDGQALEMATDVLGQRLDGPIAPLGLLADDLQRRPRRRHRRRRQARRKHERPRRVLQVIHHGLLARGEQLLRALIFRARCGGVSSAHWQTFFSATYSCLQT